MSKEDRDELSKHDPIAAMMEGHPVPATLVADHRSTLVKRVSTFALIMLVMFFAIEGYVQTRDNHHVAIGTRHIAHSTKKLAQSTKVAVNQLKHDIHDTRTTNRVLLKDVNRLQVVISKQNALLKAAGLPTVSSPFLSGSPGGTSSGVVTRPHESPTPRPTVTKTVHPTPNPVHTHKPPKHNKPPPGPKPGPVTSLLCRLAQPLTKGKCPKS